ncbi:uncharacterized protein LOC129185692 [Dunckerocampus dactyliophorus]|uniref:uncharacterized protein LOC129185692 n=1 Tax=Dunckerocampus dactyliophorus TaxID=161453 RepID=UPI002404FC19|nr:uncharacterized protein LOC129185692 [Dunckerocampus dactyliophorus]
MLTAAVWVLALLGPVQGWGLSPAAEDNTEEADFSLCSHSFYKQTPPKDGSAGQIPLRPLCHRLPGGHDFATLHRPDCDTAVGSALRLSHGWTETSRQEGEELVAVEENGVFIPALLRGGKVASSPEDSPLQRWDSTVSTLVHSTISPQCFALSGDLYILTGADGCQTLPLWSAMCCSVPGGKGSFSVGFISATDDEGQRQVSMKELQEMLEVEELFSGGCEGADVESAGVTVRLHTEAQTENTEESTADSTELHSTSQDVTLDEGNSEANEAKESAHTSKSSGGETTNAGEKAAVTHYDEASTEQKDANSSSIVVSIISTILTILKTPLRPVFSRITQFPGQVTYVLQEDLGVLSALPGDTVSLFYLLTSDLLSWMRWAAEMLFGIGERCVYGIYHCTSSMLGELLNCCYTGVTGMGTLAGDTLGIFGDALDNTWWVTRLFGGRLLERSGGYVGTVTMEMGDQAASVGGGLGKLAWRSGSGVFSVFSVGGSIIFGVVNVVFGAVAEGFGQETATVHTDVV